MEEGPGKMIIIHVVFCLIPSNILSYFLLFLKLSTHFSSASMNRCAAEVRDGRERCRLQKKYLPRFFVASHDLPIQQIFLVHLVDDKHFCKPGGYSSA